MFTSKPRVDLSAVVAFDADGALEETAETAQRHSRRRFLRTAKVLEDTGVAAYQGQAPLIHQNAVLAPAGAILAVEARHASWVRDLLYAGKSVKPAPEAFSTPMSMSQVLSAVKKTGFIKS